MTAKMPVEGREAMVREECLGGMVREGKGERGEGKRERGVLGRNGERRKGGERSVLEVG